MNGGLYNLSYTYRDREDNTAYTTTQVSRLSYSRTGATTLNFDYTYDILGNIATYKAPNKTAITYTYDNQGQLTKAEGAKTYSYTYDSVGNILTAFDGTDEHTYTYGDSDWHDKLMKFDGESITYDASGNPTSYYNGTRWTFGWSNGRNLTSASGGGKTLSFTYDLQDGTRSTKKVGNEVHNYIYAGGKLLRETYGNTKLDFLYDVNGRPYALVVNETTTYHYITNLQGDVINVVNSAGTVVASYEYDPYGYPVVQDEEDLGFTNPLRYRGYYWDAETKLYYLQSRYYDPAVGRFINADGYVSTGQGIIGHNMFVYCNNNPINSADKIGEIPSGIANPNIVQLDAYGKYDGYEIFTPTGEPLWMHTLDSGKYADSTIKDETFLLESSSTSVSSEGVTIFALDFTAFSYRLYSKYFDLFLLDFGSVEAALSMDFTGDAQASAMAAIYNPAVVFHFGKVDVTLAGQIGAVGRKYYFNPSTGFTYARGDLFGFEISANWGEKGDN